MLENGGNVSRAMRDAGYSPKTAENPTKLTRSVGFRILMEERGLTDKLLVDALVEDIKKKKYNRKQELELGFKVRGRLKDAETNFPQVNIAIFNDTQLTAVARRLLTREANGETTPDRLPDSDE